MYKDISCILRLRNAIKWYNPDEIVVDFHTGINYISSTDTGQVTRDNEYNSKLCNLMDPGT